MENNTSKEKIIIKKYTRIQTINSIFTVISIFLLPFFLIGIYISKSSESINLDFLGIPTLILIILTAVFATLTRICPNCKSYLGKYNIFPRSCPNCKIKLK